MREKNGEKRGGGRNIGVLLRDYRFEQTYEYFDSNKIRSYVTIIIHTRVRIRTFTQYRPTIRLDTFSKNG